jgi:type II secretory pathway component PulF
MLTRLRRPPAIVLWGGRPGIDVQIGSRLDRSRTDAANRLAARRRELEAIAARNLAAMRHLGVTFAEALERMRPAMDAWTAAMVDVHRRQLRALSSMAQTLERHGLTDLARERAKRRP